MTIDNSGSSRRLEEVGLILATQLTLYRGLVAQLILPAFESRLAAGTLPFNVFDRRIYSADRAADGTFRSILSEVGAKKFQCGEYGLKTPLLDSDVKIYGSRERGQLHKAQQVALSLLLAREVAAASLLFSTTTFSGASRLITIAGGAEWGAAATEAPADGGLPVTDISKAIGMLEDRGYPREKLTIVIPAKTHRILSLNKQLVEKARALPVFAALGASAVPVTMPVDVLKALFGVARVIIASGVKDTSNRAKASTFEPIWNPERVLVAYCAEGDTDDASVGRTIISSEGLDRSPLSAAEDLPADPGLIFRVEEYRDEDVAGDQIRVREQSVQLVTNADAAVLIDNCLS